MMAFLCRCSGYQFEVTCLEPVVFYSALNPRLAHRIAEAVFCVRIAMIIDGGAVYEIRLPFDAHSQVAAASGQVELALAAGGFYLHQFLVFIRAGRVRSGLCCCRYGKQADHHGKHSSKYFFHGSLYLYLYGNLGIS
jgi:hypothetical protein